MGSGFRTFTAGEVLTASNVQNYLMDQSVMTFAGSAARSSAIGTANFEEGMVSYLQDTDLVEVYNGTNWTSVAPVSDSGLIHINTTTMSAVSSQSINDVFSATYKNYQIQLNVTGDANRDLYFRFRVSGADKTTGYYRSNTVMRFDSNTVNGGSGNNIGFHFIGSTFTTPLESSGVIQVQNPFDSAQRSIIHFQHSGDNNWYSGSGFQVDATSFTGFTLYPVSGTITGTIRVYGYKN